MLNSFPQSGSSLWDLLQALLGPSTAEAADGAPGRDSLPKFPAATASKAEWDAFALKYKAARGKWWGGIDDQQFVGPYLPPPKEVADQYEWSPATGYKPRGTIFKNFSK